jgi:hypothetical protein
MSATLAHLPDSERYKLDHCPFNAKHGKDEAAIFRAAERNWELGAVITVVRISIGGMKGAGREARTDGAPTSSIELKPSSPVRPM